MAKRPVRLRLSRAKGFDLQALSLDFLLRGPDIYIEVKQFHSDRIAEQMSRAENVIAIQGEGAVRFFSALLRRAAI